MNQREDFTRPLSSLIRELVVAVAVGIAFRRVQDDLRTLFDMDTVLSEAKESVAKILEAAAAELRK